MFLEQKIDNIIKYNTPSYNYIKLAEELAELQEVIIKRYLKKPENAPPIEKVIEEAGDVLLRIAILGKMENIYEAVGERMETKADQLQNYINEGKYKGGV